MRMKLHRQYGTGLKDLRNSLTGKLKAPRDNDPSQDGQNQDGSY